MTPHIGISGKQSADDPLIFRRSLSEQTRPALSAVAGATEHLHQSEAQFRSEALAQLADAEQKAAGLTQDLAKADDRRRLYDLTAPVAGVVQQLAVHSKGAVASVAQPVLMIVPDGEGIAVEAELANKDAGFVHPGQDVEIKVESFPFTRYGTIPGEVVHVSGDAVRGRRPRGVPVEGALAVRAMLFIQCVSDS